MAADLELGPGSITLQDLPPVSALVLRAHAENGWLELREGAASYQDADVTVTGRAPLSWVIPSAGGAPGDAVIHARATNLTPAILAPFVDPDARPSSSKARWMRRWTPRAPHRTCPP